MALLRLLSRSAFICNICFLLAIGLLWVKHPVSPGISSLILVMGFLVSVILNVIVNGWLIILFYTKRAVSGIPTALIFLNGGFLAVQLILLIK